MNNLNKLLHIKWRYPELKQAMTDVLQSLYRTNDIPCATFEFWEQIACLLPEDVSIRHLAEIHNTKSKRTSKPIVTLLGILRDKQLYCATDKEAFYLIADDLIEDPSILRFPHIRDAYSIVRLPHNCHADPRKIWHKIDVGNQKLRKDLFITAREYYIGKHRQQLALIYSDLEEYVGDSYDSPQDFPFEIIFVLANKYMGTKDYYGIIAKMIELEHYFIMCHPQVDVPDTFPFTKSILLDNRVQIAKFMQEQYCGWEDFYVAQEGFSGRTERRFYCFHINNPSLAKIFREYLMSGYNTRIRNIDIIRRFEESLGKYASTILHLSDFSENTFWEQISFCKNNYINKGVPSCDKPYTLIINFYKWLLDKHSECKIFESARMISETLIRSTRLPFWISQNYEFFSTDCKDTIPAGSKAVLLIRHFDHFDENDYHAFDLSKMKCREYTSLVWKFFVSGDAGGSILYPGIYIWFFNLVFHIKLSGIAGVSSNLWRINNTELSLVYADLEGRYSNERSLNGAITGIRRILTWASEEGLLTLEPDYYNELPQKNPGPVEKRMAPVDDINRLVSYFRERAQDSLKWRHCLAVLALILLTNIRSEEIFRLKVENLEFDDENKSICFRGMVIKSTFPAKSDVSPGNVFYPIFKRLIIDTEDLRQECPVQSFRDKLFIYKSHIDYTYVEKSTFSRSLVTACEYLGIERIGPREIRKTYMTFAYVEAARYPDWEYMLSVFDGHKTPMMTIEHYAVEDIALAKLISDMSISDEERDTLMDDITSEALKRLQP